MNHLPPSSASQDHTLPANPTSAGARSTRSQQLSRTGSSEQQPLRRGPPPIATSNHPSHRPSSASGSPSRGGFSPTSTSFNHASVAVNRQIASRHSSTSSTNSLISPPSTGFTSLLHQSSRSRAVTGSGSSPRLTSSLASLPPALQSGAGIGGGFSRLARHSPSLSHSSTGSPVSSPGPHAATGSSGQLTSLVVTQLNILLSTIKEDKDRAKWETQAEKIRKLVNDSGMEVFGTYFRRLLQSNASTVFPGASRASASTDNAGSYQLLLEEMQKVAKEPQQANKIAQSLDTGEGELYRDFDLATFSDHFRLDPVAKTALVLTCRQATKPDLRAKADNILTDNWRAFCSTLASPQPSETDQEHSPLVVASTIERLVQDPPRNWDEQREHLFYAVRVGYQRRNVRIPPQVESAMYMFDLFESPDSRLARLVYRTGPRGTASLEACRDMLAAAETRDIAFPQIANALLFMVTAENGDNYNPGVFVESLRQHRTGRQVDWTDVVANFDKDALRISKKQFLMLYQALLPLAREYANFDIQTLWGGQWQHENTQLSFVVAFLSTTPDELDVMQIPNLRQAFDLTDFATASDNVRAFAEQAIKHPLVSRDATEALFTMIFRSQDTYNMAQMLGIPDSVINRNMTVFVCAASAVPKPWAPLQDQALKQLFYPFLAKQHEDYDFVMHSLWQHDKSWVATRIVEFYQPNQMLLLTIYDHCVEHGWLDLLLTLPSSFAVDLAALAHGKGRCNLDDWAQMHIGQMGLASFGQAILDFLKAKADDETAVQREQNLPSTPSLTVKTVHSLLHLVNDTFSDEVLGPMYRQCLQLYPRLFNYGEDERRNSIIDSNGKDGNGLPEAATSNMEEKYKQMYGGEITPDALVADLRRWKLSEHPADQELFAAMLSGLFEEYNCFGQYPNEALATTAVLLGGLVSYDVLTGFSQQAGIYMMFESVTEYGPEDPMYRFGLQAILHILPRLKEWPLVAERIVRTPLLRETQAYEAAESTLRDLQEENAGINGDGVNGITNGVLDDEFPADAPTPPFTAIQVDEPLREDFYQDPDEEISDKVMFVLNNVSKRNLDEKFKEIEGTVEEKYHKWLAHYLVDELARSQPNFQGLYLQLLDNFDKKSLWTEVLRETYASCQRMLNAQATMDNPHERAILKNMAGWLGSITLARDQPILQRNLSFKDLLLEGYDTQRLIVAIPFTCKTLSQAAHSKVFKPPNPWIEELLSILSELYEVGELKLNMKFEIEMLCQQFGLEVKAIAPGEIIRSRPIHDTALIQQYLPEAGPDAFGDMALMGLSKRGPNERFSPHAVIEAVPDLSSVLQIPPAAGNVTQKTLKEIFVNAAQQAIYEIIAPVVERSVTIASISTSELIQKDFITEGDEVKVRNSAHGMVKSLSGSLALVTCKEPLRMSITNNIRLLASRHLTEQLPEGQIIMFVNDNIDIVCSLVEDAAEEHSLAEIDLQLQQAVDERRQHNEQRPNEPFNHAPPNRWATLIPEPFRQDQNGLNRQQLALYEDFGRQARITPTAHITNVSQDSSRQLPDVLSGDGFLPNLQTPAEAPVMPRTAQQLRMQGIPAQAQHQVNGYIDSSSVASRIHDLLQELQQLSHEAPEEHVNEIGEGSSIRTVFEQLVGMIESSPQRDTLAALFGPQCILVIYSDARKRLEIDVFVRLLSQLCRLSIPACRNITLQLVTDETDRMFNATATILLLGEGLMDVQHIDRMVASALKKRRTVALSYFRDIVDELLLTDNPVALRVEFIHSYDALVQWLSEQSDLEVGREIMSKLQAPASQQNGLNSPQSEGKGDQLEYLFEEWVQLQRKDTPARACFAFLRQLHERHVLSDPEVALSFFRSCAEVSVANFEHVTSMPYGTADQAYVTVDALAKLIAYMTLYQGAINGESQVRNGKTLETIMSLVVLVMNESHNKQGEHWNGRVYFRLLSTLLCEIWTGRDKLDPTQEREVYAVLANTLRVVQPRYFPGFTYHWLALISHRLLVPVLLTGNGRSNGGWDHFTRLLVTLFANLEALLETPSAPPVVQDFYRGVLRFFMMLHHDFPEYLIENHMQLDSSIPQQCVQLLNIVNSAVVRTVFSDQPDPFTPGLKINRLEQVRQAPAVHSDISNVLEEAGIKDTIHRVCSGANMSDADFDGILAAVDRQDGQLSTILTNAVVLHIGVHATSASSVFSSAATPARLLERLLRESRSAARFHIIDAMANQLRYVNAHTHYFSTALQHMFSIGAAELQEEIMCVLCERLMVPRPHPWGLIVMMLELVKNQTLDIWSLSWMKTAPQVESMLMSLARSQELQLRSPIGGVGGPGIL